MAEAQLQKPVEELVDILPLEDVRMGEEEIRFLENSAGTLYVVEEEKTSGNRRDIEIEPGAEVGRIEAGDQLEITKVDPADLDESDLQDVAGNANMGD
ncbi:hypothetical protein OB919_15890 [Halobacteria archaeon AArc-curdl1]|uniref:Uncharacterized protein n=1 Tax=Natronosalvus hydrolyticus TaxID=2979988 RepID=A0AAP3E7B8_9EURY|nr:hypothetical protein [Halobacteria archaeon AArc-curdl1]